MDKCDGCQNILPFNALSRVMAKTVVENNREGSQANRKPMLNIFNGKLSPQPCGIYSALLDSNDSPDVSLVRTASSFYYRRLKPNCFKTALRSGIHGAVVGSVFGGVMGVSNAISGGLKGSSIAVYAGQSALRNAVAFSSWTALFGFSKCGLVRLRNRDDFFNAAAAGFFTGGALTLIQTRGYWRFYQSSILSNAASSAMIAIVFYALNQM